MAEFTPTYSWQSPLDESNADLPIDLALDALDKFKNNEELAFDEDGLVQAALACRPDLVAFAGISVEGEGNA